MQWVCGRIKPSQLRPCHPQSSRVRASSAEKALWTTKLPPTRSTTTVGQHLVTANLYLNTYDIDLAVLLFRQLYTGGPIRTKLARLDGHTVIRINLMISYQRGYSGNFFIIITALLLSHCISDATLTVDVVKLH